MSTWSGNEQLLEMFLFETSQNLELLESTILEGEANEQWNEHIINEVFRVMHTIKGSAAMMSYVNVSQLAHAIEDVVFVLREQHPTHVDYAALSDLIFQGMDFIKVELEKVQANAAPDGNPKELIETVKRFLDQLKQQVSAEETDNQAVKPTPNVSHGNAAPNDSTRENVTLSSAASVDSDCAATLLQPRETSCNTVVKPTANPVEASDAVAKNQQAMISVRVDKLDKFMDLVGEMVIAESMVTHNPDLRDLELENFHKAAAQLRKITHELKDIALSIRMVPLAMTFQRMHRIVRDMAKKLDKPVQLHLVGEDIEVDKNIMEHITDPLMHLVRNAIDHGIETHAERLASGKVEPPMVTLEACNSGSDVLVLVRDNGRGLDREKILTKAKAKGLLQRPADELTDKDVFQFIFHPGFSTNEQVTEFSGRGVGMDVVAKNIEKIGGSVSIDSQVQRGTVITLKIPTTLAIIDGMNLRVDESLYTIPTTAILESFRANPSDLFTDPDGNEIMMVRGHPHPVLRLAQLFEIRDEKSSIEDGIVIRVAHEGRALCLVADELLGTQQVVVKSLPKYLLMLRNIQTLAGCTLLGDGSISLILNVAGLQSSQSLAVPSH